METTIKEIGLRLEELEGMFGSLEKTVEYLTGRFELLRKSDDDLRDLLNAHLRKSDAAVGKMDRLIALVSLRSDRLDLLVSSMDGFKAELAEVHRLLVDFVKTEGVPNES